MSNNVLQRVTALTAEELEKDKPCTVELDGKFRAEWKNEAAFTLIHDDKDIHERVTRHDDKVSLIMKLSHKRRNRHLVSLGLDNVVRIFQYEDIERGKIYDVATLNSHKDTIFGILELTNGDLVTVSKSSINFWNPITGHCKAIINANINNFDALRFFVDTRKLAVNETNGISIWRFSGEKVAYLKGEKNVLISVYTLKNGNTLSKDVNNKVSLWSDNGDNLNRFPFSFDFTNDLIENLEDDSMLVKKNDGTISLWRTNGTLINEHVASEDTRKLFDTLSACRHKVYAHIRNKPTIDYYPHYRNFYRSKAAKSIFIPHREIREQKLDLEYNKRQKSIWQFFARPDREAIDTAMKDEIRDSRSAERTIAEKVSNIKETQTTYEKRRKRKSKISLFFFIAALCAAALAGVLSQQNSPVDTYNQFASDISPVLRTSSFEVILTGFAFIAGFLLLLSLSSLSKSRKAKRMVAREAANLVVLNAISQAYTIIINRIKHHREKINDDRPKGADNAMFFGTKDHRTPVRDLIDRQIAGEIEQKGLIECGLVKEDVIYTENQAIVLSDWALIQSDEKRSQILSKLQSDNECGFWFDANGPMFAVQYIQFIYLTAEKIDVYTTFYDFIAQQYIGSEANAFYYKDVTNISKREVERLAMNGSGDFSATEIALSVSSGEQIRLTILNEESVKHMSDKARQSNEQASGEEFRKIAKLEAEKEALESSDDSDSDDIEEEILRIEEEIVRLKAKAGDNATSEGVKASGMKKADEAIANIRRQIHYHKQEGVAEPS